MASSLARELASGGARLLQIASGVYLFREYVAEPTLVRGGRERDGGEAERPAVSVLARSSTPTPHPSTPFFISIFLPVQCVGPSMLPTLHARGDVVLLAPGPVRRGQLAIGDIVVARSPVNPRHTVCKRVAGLPGGSVDPLRPPSSSSSSSSLFSIRATTALLSFDII
jgi:hypothetical protein